MVKMCDVMKRVGVCASLLLAGLAMSACATEGGPTNETANEPIAEVDLANGSRVMFYEPVAGVLAIGESTALGVAPIETAGRSPVEVYRSIAPGRPVPELLAEAQARADEARRDQSVREVPEKPAKGSTESITANGFDNTFCQDSYYSNIHCHLGSQNGGVTTVLDGTHSDIDEFSTTLCVNSGKVEFRTWVEGDQRLDVQLFGGDCWTYHWWSGLFNADSMRVATTILSTSANYFLTVKWNQ